MLARAGAALQALPPLVLATAVPLLEALVARAREDDAVAAALAEVRQAGYGRLEVIVQDGRVLDVIPAVRRRVHPGLPP